VSVPGDDYRKLEMLSTYPKGSDIVESTIAIPTWPGILDSVILAIYQSTQ